MARPLKPPLSPADSMRVYVKNVYYDVRKWEPCLQFGVLSCPLCCPMSSKSHVVYGCRGGANGLGGDRYLQLHGHSGMSAAVLAAEQAEASPLLPLSDLRHFGFRAKVQGCGFIGLIGFRV